MLREDRSLLLFPLFSVISIVLILATFAWPLLPHLRSLAPNGPRSPDRVMALIDVFLFYFLQFSVMNFFNTALVEVALRRFDGEQASVEDGLRRAWARLPAILGYSFIAATVGAVLRMLQERVGSVARIVIGLFGFAWTVASALVVPVLAAEDVGPVEAISRSADLIRKAWGEELIGNGGIGLLGALILCALFLIGGFLTVKAFALGTTLGIVVLILFVLAVSLVALAQMTLQGIYAAALYRYADGDAATGGIDKAVLEQAFRPRGEG